jgi:hypothetical protein
MNPFKHTKSFMPFLSCLLFCTLLTTTSCQKEPIPKEPTSKEPNAQSFSGDVVISWLNMQLKLTQTTPASPTFPPRRYAYTGIALYESIVPGLAGYQSIVAQLNGLPALPTVTPKMKYYWPACANAAMAAMNRNFHPTTSAANKFSIDSLEAANTALYLKEASADELARSVEFGKQIAAAVFEWSKSDGYDNATPYIPPTGPGLWVPTPPAFAAPGLPNFGKGRLIVSGSDAGADQGFPIPYSEDLSSAYYAQAKEVYDISQSMTAEQKTIALFWADNPDGKSFASGHWHSILSQVLSIEKAKLDVAAVAFTKLGIAVADAQISLFKSKYLYNGLRPITYIRTVMNHPEWNALINTPSHPEYPAGHGVSSGAAAQMLTLLFGDNYKFTDNSYNNLVGFKARSFNSFEEAAIEAGDSRVYCGVHYRKTSEMSLAHGKVIAQNIHKLKFKK